MPNDNGNFLMNNEEKEILIREESLSAKYIKPFISAREFINGINRWCLWLKDVNPNELNKMPKVLKKIEAVKRHRLKSSRNATKKLADVPMLFGEIRQPDSNYIVIPCHSSETRKYIPMGFLDSNCIVGNSCLAVPNADLFHFGVLVSSMHMVWVKNICGRIKSDFRYSNNLVYNNFPWPINVDKKIKKSIEKNAENILRIRSEFENCSLADLYNPLTMPERLLKIHTELDKAVEKCYTPSPFNKDIDRIQFLFNLFQEYNSPLMS